MQQSVTVFRHAAVSRRCYPAVRFCILCTLLVAGFGVTGPAAATTQFSFSQVVDQARALAAKPYQPEPTVPDRFAHLTFDQWNNIQFKRSKALWRDARFHIQAPPAGYLHTRPVTIHLIDDQGVHPLQFSPEFFDYDPSKIGGPLPDNLGFAGFRMTYPINRPDKQDEFLSFLGASYFRAVPKGGWFGLSARGLAIDSGMSAKEEFPRFTTFWLRKPSPNAKQVTIYALLDSPSATGAYRFVVSPNDPTRITVDATIYLRKRVKKLGLAPLTSMYFYGIGDHKPADQPYPADHDSDGLLIHTANGEWHWRALANPKTLRTVNFPMTNPAGFGLMQRDRHPRHYQASELHYSQRPSAWIEPQGNWGQGHVQLVELPTPSDYNDNIVAFWVPRNEPALNKPLHLRYTIDWGNKHITDNQAGRVISTLIGGDASAGTTKYVIDYAGGPVNKIPAKTPPKGIVDTQPGTRITENRVEKNPYTGGWRQVIQLTPLPDKPVTVHAYLSVDNKMVSERWGYMMAPKGK